MTEYTKQVEAARLQEQLTEYTKRVRYIHANNGVIETKYNSGDIHYEYTRGPKKGTVKIYRENATKQTLLDRMYRALADLRHK